MKMILYKYESTSEANFSNDEFDFTYPRAAWTDATLVSFLDRLETRYLSGFVSRVSGSTAILSRACRREARDRRIIRAVREANDTSVSGSEESVKEADQGCGWAWCASVRTNP